MSSNVVPSPNNGAQSRRSQSQVKDSSRADRRKNVCAASGDTFDITLFLEASSIALSRSLARRPIMLDPALPVTEFSALSCYAIYYQPMAGVLTA